MGESESSEVEDYRKRLETAASYGEVWEIVKDTVESALHKRRSGIMLFLDDLPIQLGAYYPLGTNNIVLNRVLVQIVEAAVESKRVVNALV
jgi:diketogulonate reductase-like aldo/keto reductase